MPGWKKRPSANPSSSTSKSNKRQASKFSRSRRQYSKNQEYNNNNNSNRKNANTAYDPSENSSFNGEQRNGRNGRNGRDKDKNDSESDDEEGDEEVEEDFRKKRVLCLYNPNMYNLGAAYYDPEARKLFVVEDTKDSRTWDLAMLLMEQVEPTEVLVSTKVPDTLLDTIKEYCEENKTCKVTFQPHKTFSAYAASLQLCNVKLPDSHHSRNPYTPRTAPIQSYQNDEDDTSVSGSHQEEAVEYDGFDAGMGQFRLGLLKLDSWMNLQAVGMICAAGGLLAYLQQKDPGGSHDVLSLRGIENLTFDDHLLINHDALTSLGIFDAEAHANMHNSKQQEALSLFGLLNTCMTPMGKKLLYTWFLRPLTNLEELNARHAAVAVFSSPTNSYYVGEMHGRMKKIGNVGRICTSLRRGRQMFRDWRALVDSIEAAMDVRETAMSMGRQADIQVIQTMAEAVDEEIHSFLRDVVQTIDWDESRLEKRVVVRWGIDPELDRFKREYHQHTETLSRVADAISKDLPRHITFQDLKVIYVPQFGHLIQVEFFQGHEDYPPDWFRCWHDGGDYYFTCDKTHQLNEHFGDLWNNIMDQEQIHVQRITDRLREVEPDLLVAVDATAELDCILALAGAVSTFGLVRPTMVEEPVLKIRNGRHLLHEMVVRENEYVSNDTKISGGRSDPESCNMMLVTGANGSGKSAYGKQVALIVFMAQIGSFVPAESAEIGICDKIFTRVQTKESVTKTGSAFMIDLAQVSHALRGATDRSLIILDEFGKGTIPSDGAGLLAGVIEYLVEDINPRSIVLTHFHELFTHRLLSEDLPVVFCHMETISYEDSDRLTYLFKLKPTLCLNSFAAECALAHGLPALVVERAKYVTECISNFEISKLINEELSPKEIQDLKEAENLTRQFLQWEIDDETQDVMDVLREMLANTLTGYGEKADGDDGSNGGLDGIVGVEGRGNGQEYVLVEPEFGDFGNQGGSAYEDED